MAFYDVNRALDRPDYANSFRQGAQYGNALRQQHQARAEQNALRELAPQIIGGDPAAYEQAAAINPEIAQQYQSAGDAQMRRLKGAIDFMDQAKQANNPQAVEAAWQQVRPYLARFGQEPPATFAEAEPKMEAARARIAMAMAGQTGVGGNVQSTYVDEAGNRVAIMRDGSTQILGGNDQGMASQTITVTGADGRQRQMTFNKRTGSYEEAQFGGPPSPSQSAPQPQGWQQTGPTMFTAADGQPIPQEDQQALLAAVRQAEATGGEVNVPASQPAPMQQGGQLPPRLDYQNGGNVNPFVGRSPEQQAALTEQAKSQVQLANLPAELALRRDAALSQAEGEGAITLQNEAASLNATRSRDANKTLNLLAEAEQLLPGATGSTSGALADDVAAVFGRSTEGAQKTAALKTIAGQLTSSMPRMQGPQSDKDVQLYKEMAGDLANDRLPVPTRKAALNTIRLLNQKYAGQQAAPEPSSSAIQRARNPQTGEVVELRNGQWVPVQ